MSLNSITDKFGKKLNLYAKDVEMEYLLTNSVACANLSATNIVGTTASISDSVTTTYFRTEKEKSFSTSSDVVLTSSSPAGFIALISDVTWDRSIREKYDPDTSSYVRTLKIKVRCDCTVGIPPGADICGFYITVNNVPAEFHNATLRFGFADFRTQAGTIGTSGLGLWTVDTSVVNKITFSLANSNHSNVFQGSNIMNASFEVRALP